MSITKKQEQHGMSRTRIYAIWRDMKSRCYNKAVFSYVRYGAKGITVCDSWKDSFINFYEDMKEGYSDDLTIDRINTFGNYEPENCKWSTKTEQMHNRSDSKYVTHEGVKKHTIDLAKELGVTAQLLNSRIDRGLSTDEIIAPISKYMTKILQKDLSGKEVKTWDNIMEAVNMGNFHHSAIVDVCNGRYSQHKGFIWEYLNKEMVTAWK